MAPPPYLRMIAHTFGIGLLLLTAMIIGAKPNLYSEAIELVCGRSPIGCLLVERKGQLKGKLEQQQHRTSLDQLLVQHKCTVMGKINTKKKLFTAPVFPLKGPSSL